jgi:hypothetical protein
MRTPILKAVFSLVVLLFVAGPASHAQSSAPQAPGHSEWRPGVRYTTGAYYVNGSGFEKKLVNGDPNLGHWNWSPVIGYNQGSLKTSKGAVSAPMPMPERKSVYIKPNHVALPVVNHPSVKVAALVKPKLEPSEGSTSNRTETHTQAVLSYAGDYHGYDGFRAAANVRGVLAHRTVGAMLSQSMRY